MEELSFAMLAGLNPLNVDPALHDSGARGGDSGDSSRGGGGDSSRGGGDANESGCVHDHLQIQHQMLPNAFEDLVSKLLTCTRTGGLLHPEQPQAAKDLMHA